MASILFVLASLGDALTMLALPAGSERNLLAQTYPLLSFLLKVLLILFVLKAPLGKYKSSVVLIGLTVGSIGLGSNLSVLL